MGLLAHRLLVGVRVCHIKFDRLLDKLLLTLNNYSKFIFLIKINKTKLF